MYQPRSLPTGDSPGKKDKASEPVIMLGGAVLGGPARLRHDRKASESETRSLVQTRVIN